MEDYPKCCELIVGGGIPEDASTARELKDMILQDSSLGELRVANEAHRNVELPTYVAVFEDLSFLY